MDHSLCFLLGPVCRSSPVCVFAATGAAVALPGRVAGPYLHRAGQEQEEPVFLLIQQRDSLSASQTAGGWPLGFHVKATLLTGPSDRHGNRAVCRRGGRHLHDGQSAQCCDPGLLYVLLLSDASRVCAQGANVMLVECMLVECMLVGPLQVCLHHSSYVLLSMFHQAHLSLCLNHSPGPQSYVMTSLKMLN